MILMIDNYDSFTYNLVQYLGELGAEVKTVRNDEISVDEVSLMNPEGIVISPGPCTPNEAGICVELVQRLGEFIPMLGVCLGHQCIGQAFGGRIVRAQRIMHGKTSKIFHRSQGIFQNLPQPFDATRYHSLVIDRDSMPEDLTVMAWTETDDDHEIMGVKHLKYPIHGVQFHPESILTRCGHDLLRNFLKTVSSRYLE
jgi:anthranilate synthase component II